MVFPVVMYGCESWTIKKAECQRIDAFELWFWRRLLRVPWTVRRSNQSILKEISPECSLWPSDAKNWLVGKDPEGRRWKGWQRMRCWLASPTRWRWAWVGSGSWWWTGRPGVLWFLGSQRVGHNWATELNWTSMKCSWRAPYHSHSIVFLYFFTLRI